MKYLVITKEKDYIATKTECKRIIKDLGMKCLIYDKNGMLIYPAQLYDGMDRIWAKEFIKNHKVGDSTKDVQEEYYISKRREKDDL